MADEPAGATQTGDTYSAEEARKHFADLLNAAQWEGKHVTISRGRRRAAVVVPPDWHDRAVAALADHDRSPRKRA